MVFTQMDSSVDLATATWRTKRLTLAPLARQYARALHPLQSDWEVVRMLASVPWPLALSDIEAFAAKQQTAPRESDNFVMLSKGAPIGVCGVKIPGSGDPPRKMPRLGYWVGRPHWGMGFATEALAALIERAFRVFPHDTVGAGVFHDNPASRRVLEKLGFAENARYETSCLSRGAPVLTIDMHLARGDFEAGSR